MDNDPALDVQVNNLIERRNYSQIVDTVLQHRDALDGKQESLEDTLHVLTSILFKCIDEVKDDTSFYSAFEKLQSGFGSNFLLNETTLFGQARLFSDADRVQIVMDAKDEIDVKDVQFMVRRSNAIKHLIGGDEPKDEYYIAQMMSRKYYDPVLEEMVTSNVDGDMKIDHEARLIATQQYLMRKYAGQGYVEAIDYIKKWFETLQTEPDYIPKNPGEFAKIFYNGQGELGGMRHFLSHASYWYARADDTIKEKMTAAGISEDFSWVINQTWRYLTALNTTFGLETSTADHYRETQINLMQSLAKALVPENESNYHNLSSALAETANLLEALNSSKSKTLLDIYITLPSYLIKWLGTYTSSLNEAQSSLKQYVYAESSKLRLLQQGVDQQTRNDEGMYVLDVRNPLHYEHVLKVLVVNPRPLNKLFSLRVPKAQLLNIDPEHLGTVLKMGESGLHLVNEDVVAFINSIVEEYQKIQNILVEKDIFSFEPLIQLGDKRVGIDTQFDGLVREKKKGLSNYFQSRVKLHEEWANVVFSMKDEEVAPNKVYVFRKEDEGLLSFLKIEEEITTGTILYVPELVGETVGDVDSAPIINFHPYLIPYKGILTYYPEYWEEESPFYNESSPRPIVEHNDVKYKKNYRYYGSWILGKENEWLGVIPRNLGSGLAIYPSSAQFLFPNDLKDRLTELSPDEQETYKEFLKYKTRRFIPVGVSGDEL